MCLWVYSRGWTGPGGSGPDGLDGRIPASVQGDEGMNEGMNKGRELPFLGERKEVNHFRQQTAPAGRRQLPEVGDLIEG